MAPVPVLLLHCYPFHRQAGYLAQAFDHVNFDVGLAINYPRQPIDRLVAEALDTAPFAKQLYSSGRVRPPELHLLGAVLWRRAMGWSSAGGCARGDCAEQDAIAIVDMIGMRNAARVYGLSASEVRQHFGFGPFWVATLSTDSSTRAWDSSPAASAFSSRSSTAAPRRW